MDQRSEMGRVCGLALRSGPCGLLQPATRGEVRIPPGSSDAGHLWAVPQVLPHDDLQQGAGYETQQSVTSQSGCFAQCPTDSINFMPLPL